MFFNTFGLDYYVEGHSLELETWKTDITEFLHTYHDYRADKKKRVLLVPVVSTLKKFLTNCERENVI